MAFINASDKYYKWRYNITELYILYPDGTETSIPTHRVNSITLTHLFENNLFPIFRFEIVLAGYTYYKILKNKKDIKFKLRIQKYYMETGKSEKSLQRDWINDTFDLILDDDDIYADKDLLKEKKEHSYDYTMDKNLDNDLFQVDNVVEIFLFKSNLVNKLNKLVNAVLSNATINDAIQYIASEIELNNLLMTIPHNNTIYKELVIPPLKAKQAIKFLDTYYGLYKTGMLFYSDMIDNITYLLDYSSKCTAFQDKELIETHILVPKKSSKYSADLCSLYRRGNNETNFIITDGSKMSIRNETISYNEYSATNAKIIDAYDGIISSSNTNVTIKNNKTTKIIENNTENQWFSDIYNSLINAKNVVIDVPLADYDISAVTLNKSYKLVFEDPELSLKYKGNLLLAEANHVFAKEGESFTLTSIIKLRQF